MHTAQNERTLFEQLREMPLSGRAHLLSLLVTDLRLSAERNIPSEALRGEISQRLRPLERELGKLELVLEHVTKVTKLPSVGESA